MFWYVSILQQKVKPQLHQGIVFQLELDEVKSIQRKCSAVDSGWHLNSLTAQPRTLGLSDLSYACHTEVARTIWYGNLTGMHSLGMLLSSIRALTFKVWSFLIAYSYCMVQWPQLHGFRNQWMKGGETPKNLLGNLYFSIPMASYRTWFACWKVMWTLLSGDNLGFH